MKKASSKTPRASPDVARVDGASYLFKLKRNIKIYVLCVYKKVAISIYESDLFHDFEEVAQGLCRGKKFRRIKWKSSIFIGQNGKLTIDGENDIEWGINDFLANHWIEVK